MMRPVSSAALIAGIVAATTLACSDSSDPSSLTTLEPLANATTPKLTPQSSGTTQRLQAISPVNNRVAWASGTGGTFAVTTDGGATLARPASCRGRGSCNSATCRA